MKSHTHTQLLSKRVTRAAAKAAKRELHRSLRREDALACMAGVEHCDSYMPDIEPPVLAHARPTIQVLTKKQAIQQAAAAANPLRTGWVRARDIRARWMGGPSNPAAFTRAYKVFLAHVLPADHVANISSRDVYAAAVTAERHGRISVAEMDAIGIYHAKDIAKQYNATPDGWAVAQA